MINIENTSEDEHLHSIAYIRNDDITKYVFFLNSKPISTSYQRDGLHSSQK